MNQNNYLQENRGGNNPPPKKKTSLKTYKKNALHSFNEIEYFLRNFSTASKYIKVFKFFKWLLSHILIRKLSICYTFY